jgi:hypothetical protein
MVAETYLISIFGRFSDSRCKMISFDRQFEIVKNGKFRKFHFETLLKNLIFTYLFFIVVVPRQSGIVNNKFRNFGVIITPIRRFGMAQC